MWFTDALITCYEKSFIIEGRASRSEYWGFQTHIPAALIFGFIVDPDRAYLYPFIVLAVSLPANFCVTVRRWHDLGYSGWYVLILVIPYFGALATLMYFCMPSETDNKYGDRSVIFDPEKSKTYKQETIPPVAPVPPVAPARQTVYQNLIQGDHVTKTEIKDSVINRSNVGSGGKSKAEQIKEIKELHNTGTIDDDEFKQMKKEILGK